MTQRHNHDLHREVRPETALGFTYTDEDGDKWVKHPSGVWLCSDERAFDGEDLISIFERQWWHVPEDQADDFDYLKERWKFVEDFLLIKEQP